MATKTISLELDAYDKLVRARRNPKESFSSVVRRAGWQDAPPTAGELLSKLEALVASAPESLLTPVVLDQMARRVRTRRATSRWEQK